MAEQILPITKYTQRDQLPFVPGNKRKCDFCGIWVPNGKECKLCKRTQLSLNGPGRLGGSSTRTSSVHGRSLANSRYDSNFQPEYTDDSNSRNRLRSASASGVRGAAYAGTNDPFIKRIDLRDPNPQRPRADASRTRTVSLGAPLVSRNGHTSTLTPIVLEPTICSSPQVPPSHIISRHNLSSGSHIPHRVVLPSASRYDDGCRTDEVCVPIADACGGALRDGPSYVTTVGHQRTHSTGGRFYSPLSVRTEVHPIGTAGTGGCIVEPCRETGVVSRVRSSTTGAVGHRTTLSSHTGLVAHVDDAAREAELRAARAGEATVIHAPLRVTRTLSSGPCVDGMRIPCSDGIAVHQTLSSCAPVLAPHPIHTPAFVTPMVHVGAPPCIEVNGPPSHRIVHGHMQPPTVLHRGSRVHAIGAPEIPAMVCETPATLYSTHHAHGTHRVIHTTAPVIAHETHKVVHKTPCLTTHVVPEVTHVPVRRLVTERYECDGPCAPHGGIAHAHSLSPSPGAVPQLVSASIPPPPRASVSTSPARVHVHATQTSASHAMAAPMWTAGCAPLPPPPEAETISECVPFTMGAGVCSGGVIRSGNFGGGVVHSVGPSVCEPRVTHHTTRVVHHGESIIPREVHHLREINRPTIERSHWDGAPSRVVHAPSHYRTISSSRREI